MPTPNLDIEGVWSGHYHYRKIFGLTLMRPVQFFAVFDCGDDGLRGRIYEPNTFGNRSTDHLEADMLNLEIADRSIRFRKKYNGTGGVKHGISYQGDISSDGLRILGTWNIGWLTSGTFELAKENPELAERFRRDVASDA